MKKKHLQRGLTLIEVVIAIAIMMLVFVTASALMMGGLASYRFNYELLTANQDARYTLLRISQDLHNHPTEEISIDHGANTITINEAGGSSYTYSFNSGTGQIMCGGAVIAEAVTGFDLEDLGDNFLKIKLSTSSFDVETTILVTPINIDLTESGDAA